MASPERVASPEPGDDDVLKEGIQGVFHSFEYSILPRHIPQYLGPGRYKPLRCRRP